MKSILVIDDGRALAELVRHLSIDEFETVTAHSMADAIAALEETPFDVIIIDLTMPRSDASSVMASIARAAPTAPVVAITGGLEESCTQWLDEVAGIVNMAAQKGLRRIDQQAYA